MKKCSKGRLRHQWIHPLVEQAPAGRSYFITEILACPWCGTVKKTKWLTANLKEVRDHLRATQ